MKYNTIFFILFLNFVSILLKKKCFLQLNTILLHFTIMRIRKFFFYKLCILIFE